MAGAIPLNETLITVFVFSTQLCGHLCGDVFAKPSVHTMV